MNPNTLFFSFELLPVPLLDLPVIGSFGNSLSLGSDTVIGIPSPTGAPPICASSMPFSIPAVVYGLPDAENGWCGKGGGAPVGRKCECEMGDPPGVRFVGGDSGPADAMPFNRLVSKGIVPARDGRGGGRPDTPPFDVMPVPAPDANPEGAPPENLFGLGELVADLLWKGREPDARDA